MSQFKTPLPDLQITFYNRLRELRESFLLQALLRAVSTLEIHELDKELSLFVPKSDLQVTASWGLRGELLFPIPYLLTNRPQLLGYYRLLLGFSQKEFYGKQYGFGPMKSMEEKGSISSRQQDALPEFCKTLCKSSEYLITGVGQLSTNALHELTLLTLGAQLRGGALNLFGAQATQRVFELIKTIVTPAITESTPRSIELRNAAGRAVAVEFANDPDICIREKLPSGNFRNLVAVEIKGGRDYSNIHNRIGEAEKSHQKARKEGFVECWTIVGVHSLDITKAKKESPSTDRFFRMDSITRPGSDEFRDFREHLLSRVGVKD
jgi:hypothetical protein